MDNSALLNKILFAQTSRGQAAEITVTGVSMNPAFFEGDRITVRRAENYEVGDINEDKTQRFHRS